MRKIAFILAIIIGGLIVFLVNTHTDETDYERTIRYYRCKEEVAYMGYEFADRWCMKEVYEIELIENEK